MKIRDLFVIGLLFGGVFFSFISLIGLVSAVGVSGTYTNNRPLEMYAGEVEEVVLTLQNMAGENDVKFDAKVVKGSEIVGLVDEDTEYLVPLGSNDVLVRLKAQVPEEAVIDQEYDVLVVFNPVAIEGVEGEGMVQIALGLSREFKVIVVEKVEEELPVLKEVPVTRKINAVVIFWIIMGVLSMIIAVVIYIALRRSKKEEISEQATFYR